MQQRRRWHRSTSLSPPHVVEAVHAVRSITDEIRLSEVRKLQVQPRRSIDAGREDRVDTSRDPLGGEIKHVVEEETTRGHHPVLRAEVLEW